ncbi:hypothetical protein [Lacticaseibacillus sharpeae]|uniref:hypothetical protein n=1 Tax=Lacticaseibacillus sharpeae TaxID=1626 RepID=UPI001CDA60DE|nr:hypothetical protein [Lacticaseibacillus sharpeae]
MIIYAAFKLKPEHLAALKKAGHKLILPADFNLDAAAKTVDAILGWDQNAQASSLGTTTCAGFRPPQRVWTTCR